MQQLPNSESLPEIAIEGAGGTGIYQLSDKICPEFLCVELQKHRTDNELNAQKTSKHVLAKEFSSMTTTVQQIPTLVKNVSLRGFQP